MPVALQPGEADSDDSSAPQRACLDSLRTPRGRMLRRSGTAPAIRGEKQAPWKRREHGSRRKPKAGFHRLPHSLGNLAEGARFPLSHSADDGGCCLEDQDKGQNQTQGGGPKGRFALPYKADRSLVNKTGQLDLLTTPGV